MMRKSEYTLPPTDVQVFVLVCAQSSACRHFDKIPQLLMTFCKFFLHNNQGFPKVM
jgi:hypothetical protein